MIAKAAALAMPCTAMAGRHSCRVAGSKIAVHWIALIGLSVQVQVDTQYKELRLEGKPQTAR
jgi:hypothetical protein